MIVASDHRLIILTSSVLIIYKKNA